MQTFIALLRGINVSGHNLIKMSNLRLMFEEMGLAGVKTYIQSGNVLFRSAEEAEPLRERIEQQIQATFGMSVPVVLRTAHDLAQVIAGSPFHATDLTADESLYVALLAETPAPEAIDRLLAFQSGTDQFQLVGREVYLLYRQPFHKSKLTNQLLEQRLRVASTMRNWRTVTTLAAMAQAH